MSNFKFPTCIAVSLIVLGSCHLAHAAGGDGGVFNGPSLQGNSIPVATDRGLSLADVSDAYQFCGVKGDLAQGVRPLGVLLLQDIHGGTLADWMTRSPYIPAGTELVRDQKDEKAIQPALQFEYSENSVVPNLIRGEFYPFWNEKTGDGSKVKLSFNEATNDGKVRTISLSTRPGAFLPYVKYDSREAVYGELGEELEVHYVGLSLQVPENYRDPKRFYSADGHPTSLSLKLADFVDCLRAKLAR